MANSGISASITQILSDRLPEEIGTERDFKRWLDPLMMRVSIAADRVHRDVRATLDAARERIHEQEGGGRKVWFVTGTDGESLIKSVASIRSKLGRKIRKLVAANQLPDGRMSLDQVEKLLLAFRDLGRFRVVCDLSLDVSGRSGRRAEPGRTRGHSRGSPREAAPRLSPPQGTSPIWQDECSAVPEKDPL
jgi:hypothetical protein